MPMQGAKKNFRIEQISKKLGLKKSTLRDWEAEFNLSTSHKKGSNRHYTSDDLAVFSKIKDLSAQKDITKEEIATTVQSWVKAQSKTTSTQTPPTSQQKTPVIKFPIIIIPTAPKPSKAAIKIKAEPCNHDNLLHTIKQKLQTLHAKLDKPCQPTQEK